MKNILIGILLLLSGFIYSQSSSSGTLSNGSSGVTGGFQVYYLTNLSDTTTLISPRKNESLFITSNNKFYKRTSYWALQATISSGSGTITNVRGTTNQITSSGTTDITISLPSDVTIGNKINTTYINLNTVTANNLSIPIHIGDATNVTSVDPAIYVNRAISTGTGNAHGFADGTNVSRSGSIGYAAFDARGSVSGSSAFDHYAGFQSAPTYSNSNTMTNLYGYYYAPAVSGGGTITNAYGAYMANMQPITGTVTNNYGLYIEALNRGGTNYAIFTAGSTASSLGGAVTIGGSTTSTGTIFANSVGANFRMKADGTTSKDGGIYANAGGDIYFANWDANRGFAVLSTGKITILNAAAFLQFGNVTSAFPALKRSTTNLLVRLADDSGDAGLSCSQLTTSTGITAVTTATTGNGIYVTNTTLTTGMAQQINVTSTALSSTTPCALKLMMSGANANTAVTATGINIGVTNTNATSGTNIAAQFSASGATTANYALIVPSGGGSVGIGNNPVASALLDIASTTKGVLMPRMTTTQKNAISGPAEGLIVYDTTLHKLCVYTGSAWETITSL